MQKKKKYSYAFKKAAVEAAKSSKASIHALARAYGIHESMLRRWIDGYEAFGPSALACVSHQHRYSESIKTAAVAAFLTQDLSLREVCLTFSLRSTSVLRGWINRALANYPQQSDELNDFPPMASSQSSRVPASEYERVVEENKRLQAEVAYLKKLRALIQAQKKGKKP
ncbi:transposase [Siphonobacter sp. SORGH_AS_0500]|uniref:transposase n=1 Tax=Siphonobacter sp. SORGH_AS_0500 TaxID=1864824 RepID=UPI00285EB3C7|nr:transposase [Siphonobacter sp. SORGH_AS_0500]MDR6193000.1 transposase [Siphonobacter sp. SORGH_AS_0500]MDR6193550.1 transposase [Siphonobacter sp. SORGH_AS_0500]MDR6195432.1 transposase [Siphonobacter sp. SORGH_AS_0500]MDR6195513.1 transposase [Siphonobacter sp. SORGH_AS_0500]MDR6196570.1 transposase [Siphonobacter sp. SORGH_AS_0500]